MRMSKKQYYVMCDMDAFAEYPISVRAPRRYDKYMVNRRVVAKLDVDNFLDGVVLEQQNG